MGFFKGSVRSALSAAMLAVMLLALFAPTVNANTYNLTAPNRPAICSGNQGSWDGSTYVCTWDRPLTLNPGDVVLSNGPITILSQNGINVTNVTFGGNGNSINLRAGGSGNIQLNNSTLFGSITNTPRAQLEDGSVVHGTINTSSTVIVNDSTVHGSVLSGAPLTANGATFNSSVSSNSSLTIDNSEVVGTTSSANNFSATNTVFGNNVTSGGALTITNAEISGNLQAANAMNLIEVNVSGTTTSTNGLINISGGGYSGLVRSNCCKVTIESAAVIRAGVTAGNNGIEISDSTVEGDLTAANNPIVLTNVAMNAGNISAGQNNVTITGGVINANIPNAHRIFVYDGAQINGDLKARYEVRLNSSVVEGNVETTADHDGLHHVYMTDSFVYGNVIVRSDWGSITGNWPDSAIYGDCEYNTVTPSLCSDAPPPGSCDAISGLSEVGIVGDTNFEFGNNSEINGNTISGSGNTPTPTGSVTTVPTEFPLFEPLVFPSNLVGGPNRTNHTNIPPGSYDRIRSDGNSAFSSFSGGGTYYIEELEIDGNDAVIQFAPGDYFIEEINLDNRSHLTVFPEGLVRIFIKDKFEGKNNIFINSGGNPANLIIYLYDGAEVDVGNYNQGSGVLNFSGSIYSPFEDTEIEFGNNNNIEGSILSAGEVKVGNNTNFTYTTETQQAILEAYGCDPDAAEIHHYRIRHTLGIVSCFTAVVSVDACADASCSTLFEDPVEISLNSSAAQSEWSGGDLVSATNTTGTFKLTNGTGFIGLQNVPGGTTTLSISNTNVPAENATQCFDPTGSTPTSCQINFQTAGLIFTAANGSSPIPDQFAGSPFNVALRAVETNTTTGACEARVEGPQTVNMGVECINPSSCISGQTYQVDNTPIGFNANGVVNNFVPVDVNFDANGTAILPHNYSDVGLLRLHASLQLTPEPNPDNPDLDDPPIQLTGTSTSEYVVKPYSLIVRALDDNGDFWTDVNAGYRAAGEDFSVIIQSLNADNLPTPNFGNEMPEISLSATLDSVAFPTNGTLGNLTQTNNFSPSLTNVGAYSNDGLRWNEVGIVNLVASLADQDYLGGGDALNRPPSPVGRFYPHHFELQMNSASVTNACIGEGFTYMGQPNIEVEFIIDAVNLAGQVTTNYGRAEYNGSAIVDGFAAHDSPAIDLDNEFLERFELTTESNEAWENGSLSFSNENLIFSRFSQEPPDGPYPQTRIGLQIRDEQDSRNFLPSALALETAAGLAVQLTGELNIIYGRLVLENTYGPEGEDLPVDLRAQYWSGSRFETHTADQCTPYQVNNLALLDASVTDTQPGGIDGNLVEGAVIPGNLLWLAPTTPEPALEFEFEYDAPPWLEFNWEDADNNIHRNPRAFGSFGQFRGNDRIIFWLELR